MLGDRFTSGGLTLFVQPHTQGESSLGATPVGRGIRYFSLRRSLVAHISLAVSSATYASPSCPPNPGPESEPVSARHILASTRHLHSPRQSSSISSIFICTYEYDPTTFCLRRLSILFHPQWQPQSSSEVSRTKSSQTGAGSQPQKNATRSMSFREA